jgi:t-SNARE complex subunit (syntaxin)
MQSRLGDIQQGVAGGAGVPQTADAGQVVLSDDVEAGASESMSKFFREVEQIKATIEYVRERTKDVARLQDAAMNAVRSEDTNNTSKELDQVLSAANQRCAAAKTLLSAIKDETDRLEKAGTAAASELRIRRNMYQTLTTNFVGAVRQFQQAQQTYKSKIKAKVARQVRIVKPDATYEEIDSAMKSGDPGAIYRAAILQPGLDPVQQAYADVQAKYQDVLRLEENVRALNQMFRDMALLVERQGEMLNQIEHSVESAQVYVGQGTEQLKGALEARKSIRKKYMIIALICTVVIVVILIIVLK